jgi:hypothetical protein
MARPFQGYSAEQAVPSVPASNDDAQNGYAGLRSPPPPPSARRATPPQYPGTAPGGYTAPLQMVEPTPVDPVAETVEAPLLPGASVEGEVNPFRKPSRLREWLKKPGREWLKKPSRELMIRSGVAVLAAVVGWGFGAKPWHKAQPQRAAIAAHASAGAKGSAKPAIAVRSARPAGARAAVQSHAPSPTAAKPRTTTKPAAVAAKKKSTTTAAIKATASKSLAKTSAKAAPKPAAKTKTVAKAAVKSAG